MLGNQEDCNFRTKLVRMMCSLIVRNLNLK